MNKLKYFPLISDIDVSWVLDSKKSRNPRLFFLNEEGKNIRNSTMRLNRGKTECRTERVYIAVRFKNSFLFLVKKDLKIDFSIFSSNRKIFGIN